MGCLYIRKLTSKQKKSNLLPWNIKKEAQLRAWTLKKGKDSVTITKDDFDRNSFYLQKNDDRRLSLCSVQTRVTYHKLLDMGYRLQQAA